MYAVTSLLVFCIGYVSAAKNYGEFIPGVCDVQQTQGGWNYRPVEGSCNQYLTCDEQNKAFLMTCSHGTFYNTRKCRRAEEVDCPYDPCRHLPHGAAYNDGQSCYGFYVCKKGKSFYKTCKNGFTFHPHKQMCIPDYTCKRDNLVHPCAFGTTYPVMGRSDMFFLFDGHHRFTPMKCPDGLWYNPGLCTCDWVVPGEKIYGKCKPLFHFSYDGNFLENWNRVQQVPNSHVSIFQKSAIFSKGGKVIIWTLNDMELNNDFSFCFEFMAKNQFGETALISNDYNKVPFTYKLTFIPETGVVKGLRCYDRRFSSRSYSCWCGAGLAPNNSPLVVGAAQGCQGFVGYFDELKFFRCMPKGFFKDYKKK
ncbi:hypothetical protein KUTeg_004807 [Tegillarca granosa]|uniref:Chitin-binding type-2 domain-containing protein n=1 Tax=Tegillarca granosa TaxID=220873 RepID=A0ABQ9FMG8_TEGGR|nr:hypothetical protein KUTeg_004807 [Tegillarca granosa]